MTLKKTFSAVSKRLLLVCLLLGVCPAWPISHIGNGLVMSREDGFQAQLPQQYLTYEAVERASLRVGTLPVLRSTGQFSPNYAYLTPLRDAFPSMISLDRRGYLTAASQNGWEHLALDRECVEAHVSITQTAKALMLNWGSGKGLVVVVDANDTNTFASILQSLQIEQGACGW